MRKLKTNSEFILSAKKVHGNKYDYKKSIYTNSKEKVTIICREKEHGYFEFSQTPNCHISKKQGCPKCSNCYKCNTSEVIIQFNKIHKKKYDYSKVNYVHSKTKVIIICKQHGEFTMTPNCHLNGQGCKYCSNKATTTNDFIKKAKLNHGIKYNYSKTNYINNKKNVIITCKKHGDFKQTPNNHLAGTGCPKCFSEKNGKSRRLSELNFIKKSNLKHKNKYIYDKLKYTNSRSIVKIKCPIHGYFMQVANNHLIGLGCNKCRHLNIKIKTPEFIKRSKLKHKNKYSYLLINDLKSIKNKVKIICPIHGVFKQVASSHLLGRGCLKCGGSEKLNNKTFRYKSIKIHGNKYDYSLVNYINNTTKVKIICKKHGEFNQTASNHLMGQNCPNCKTSKSELKIAEYLKKNKIKYFRQKTFESCLNPNTNYKLRFDFYLPKHNICIEYDGIQHFKSIEYFGGEKNFNYIKYLDKLKNVFCKKNKIKLIRIPFYKDVYKSLKKIIK